MQLAFSGRDHEGDRPVFLDRDRLKIGADLLHGRVPDIAFAHQFAEEVILKLLLLNCSRFTHRQNLVGEIAVVIDQ